MPYGLKNAPSHFQRSMNLLLADLLDKCVLLYMDDILIYSKMAEEHVTHVQAVFERLAVGSQLFVSRNILFSDKFRLFREIYPKFRLCFVHVSFHVSKHGQLVAIITEAAILKRYNYIFS